MGTFRVGEVGVGGGVGGSRVWSCYSQPSLRGVGRASDWRGRGCVFQRLKKTLAALSRLETFPRRESATNRNGWLRTPSSRPRHHAPPCTLVHDAQKRKQSLVGSCSSWFGPAPLLVDCHTLDESPHHPVHTAGLCLASLSEHQAFLGLDGTEARLPWIPWNAPAWSA